MTVDTRASSNNNRCSCEANRRRGRTTFRRQDVADVASQKAAPASAITRTARINRRCFFRALGVKKALTARDLAP